MAVPDSAGGIVRLPDEKDERIIVYFLVFDMLLTLAITGVVVALTLS